jgi:hypothetical protein
MERITDAMIVRRVARLQKEGMDIGIDGQYGRFRVTNKSGGKELSPRVPNRQIMDWLDAFEQGWWAAYNSLAEGCKD